MKITKNGIVSIIVCTLILSSTAQATPVNVVVSGAFTITDGSLSSLLGSSFVSNISYDTDTSLAKPGSLAFSNDANGQALGIAYSNPVASTTITGSSIGFNSVQDLVAEIDSNKPLTSAQTGGLIPTANYDIFDFTEWAPGSTFFSPGSTIGTAGSVDNAVNVDVSFIGNLSLFPTVTSASQIPGSLDPANLVTVLVHVNQWENGVLVGNAIEIGQMNGNFNNFIIVPASVPVPGAIWLFCSAVAGFIGFHRRKQV